MCVCTFLCVFFYYYYYFWSVSLSRIQCSGNKNRFYLLAFFFWWFRCLDFVSKMVLISGGLLFWSWIAIVFILICLANWFDFTLVRVRQMPEQIDWIKKNELLLLVSLITTASLASHITELRTVERHNWDWIEIVYFNIVLCLYCFTHFFLFFFVCHLSLFRPFALRLYAYTNASTNTNEPNGTLCVRCAVCTILAVLLACWFRAEIHSHAVGRMKWRMT